MRGPCDVNSLTTVFSCIHALFLEWYTCFHNYSCTMHTWRVGGCQEAGGPGRVTSHTRSHLLTRPSGGPPLLLLRTHVTLEV